MEPSFLSLPAGGARVTMTLGRLRRALLIALCLAPRSLLAGDELALTWIAPESCPRIEEVIAAVRHLLGRHENGGGAVLEIKAVVSHVGREVASADRAP